LGCSKAPTRDSTGIGIYWDHSTKSPTRMGIQATIIKGYVLEKGNESHDAHLLLTVAVCIPPKVRKNGYTSFIQGKH